MLTRMRVWSNCLMVGARAIHKFVSVSIIGLSLFVGGCFDSVPTQQLPSTTQSRQLYTGPAPATADVQAFMTNLWDNIKDNNRCGGCHSAGGQTPSFARSDDVNAAYSDAITVVTLTSPADSRMVQKVSSGHHCWLDSNTACGAVITAYISAWASGSGVTSTGNTIDLTAPTIKDAGDSKSFPVSSAAFAATVHPLLTAHCSGCHTSSSATPQAPFFADADPDVAYEAVTSSHKIDLDTPSNSRLVVRLRDEFHNCWTSSCTNDATTMLSAIIAFAASAPVTQLDPSLVVSKALNLGDGIIASGGSRYETNLIALYEFKEASGATVYDTSGVEPAAHLTLSGTEDIDFKWVGGWGVEFIDSKAQANTASSKKLTDFIQSSGEYSIEAWIVPGNVTQENVPIISYSGGVGARNFSLGQTLYSYDYFNRSATTDANGEPGLTTNPDDEDLQATQQHVVVTYDQVNGRKVYVNGVDTGDVDAAGAGNLNDWDDTFALVLGNEVSGTKPWKGKLRLVAIHNRALTQTQIQQNYDVGVGEKYYLLFSVAALIDVPQSYVMFEVSQFDTYSYLFNKPTFISLDATAVPSNIPISGMRIGINGREASVGQAYRNLNVTLNASDYSPQTGQVLSNLGTIIASELGVDNDTFFLTFEVLGSHTNVTTEPVALATTEADGTPVADIGLRTFEEINATMSAVTGVSTTDTSVNTTYETIKQQLPTVETLEGFLSSHQVAVSQLAIEYCNALVESTSLRSAFFPGLDFSATASTAFDTQGERDLVSDPLLSNIMGSNLSSQPTAASVKTELDSLMTSLSSCGGSCASDRTKTVVKAACAAVLGSAVMLIQ